MAKNLVSALLVVSLVLTPSQAIPHPYKSRDKFSGDGTVYGPASVGGGNCAMRGSLPSMYTDDMIPVALNAEQYNGSKMCGACIKGTGAKGDFKAYVTDKCPECQYGDLDFNMEGDGRWDISWQFVECEGGGDPEFIFEGSNDWYWKIQARGTKTPVKRLKVNGKKAERTQDNFFIIDDGPYYGKQKVRTRTITKEKKKTKIALP